MFILVVSVYVFDFNSSILQFLNYLFSILPLGACDAFLRSIGAQALRGGLAKNSSIFQFFNSSILITNTLSLGLTLSGTLMLMRWPLVACSTGFRS